MVVVAVVDGGDGGSGVVMMAVMGGGDGGSGWR